MPLWNNPIVAMIALLVFFFFLLPSVIHVDLFNDRFIPKGPPLRPEMLKKVIKNLGVFITNENVAIIPFEDRIFEVSLNKGCVYVASRIKKGPKAYVCLQCLPLQSFYGWSKNIELNISELVVVAKILAILSQDFPQRVSYQIEDFLKSDRKSRYVIPVPDSSPR